MNDILKTYKEQFRENRHTLRRYTAFVLALAMITTLFVNWQLHGVGISMTAQYQCGEVEHAHTADCYDKVLICGYTEGQLENADEVAAAEAAAASAAQSSVEEEIMPLELEPQIEFVPHEHTDDCYTEVQTLTCMEEEHVHDDDCYDPEDGTLICEKFEHTHDESCYTTEYELTCGLEEGELVEQVVEPTQSAELVAMAVAEPVALEPVVDTVEPIYHHHTDACYEEVLVCPLPEHHHTVSCLSDTSADLETPEEWQAANADAVITGEWNEDLLSVAKTQLGYEQSEKNFEIDPADGVTLRYYSRYGQSYGNAYGEWDVMFLAYCLKYAEIPQSAIPQEASVLALRSSMSGMDWLLEEDGSAAQPGDIVIYNKYVTRTVAVDSSADSAEPDLDDLFSVDTAFENSADLEGSGVSALDAAPSADDSTGAQDTAATSGTQDTVLTPEPVDPQTEQPAEKPVDSADTAAPSTVTSVSGADTLAPSVVSPAAEPQTTTVTDALPVETVGIVSSVDEDADTLTVISGDVDGKVAEVTLFNTEVVGVVDVAAAQYADTYGGQLPSRPNRAPTASTAGATTPVETSDFHDFTNDITSAKLQYRGSQWENWSDITADSYIDEYAEINALLDYTLPAGTLSDTKNTIKYTLPDALKNFKEAGYVRDTSSGKTIGVGKIENGVVSITFYDEYVQMNAKGSPIYGSVAFDGKASEMEITYDQETTIKFNESHSSTIIIKKDSKKYGDLHTQKSIIDSDLANGTVKYTVKVWSTYGTAGHPVTLDDIMTNIQLDTTKGITVTKNTYTSVDSSSLTYTLGNKGFTGTLPALGEDEYYELTYWGMLPSDLKGGNVTTTNQIHVESTNSKGEKIDSDSSVNFNFNTVKKTGVKNDDDTISWTVTLNENHAEMKGWTLSDELNGSDYKGTVHFVTSTGASFDDALPYKFGTNSADTDTTASYTITYKTPGHHDYNTSQVKNKVTLKDDHDNEKGSSEYDVEVGSKDAYFKDGKGVIENTDGTLTLNWHIKLIIDKDYAAGWKWYDQASCYNAQYFTPKQRQDLYDELDRVLNGHHYEVSDAYGNKKTDDYTGTWDTIGIIGTKPLTKGTVLEFDFSTTIKRPDKKTDFKNQCYFNSTAFDGTNTYRPNGNAIVKKYDKATGSADNSSHDYHDISGKLQWTIEVTLTEAFKNAEKAGLTHINITDTLPAGVTLDDIDISGEGHWGKNGNITKTSNSWTFPTWVHNPGNRQGPDLTATLSTLSDGKQSVDIEVPVELLSVMEQDQKILVYIYANITENPELWKSSQKNFTNEVKVTDSTSKDWGSASQTQEITYNSLHDAVKKSGVQVDESEAQNTIEYSVIVNPDGKVILNNPNIKLTLIDELKYGYNPWHDKQVTSLVPSSVAVYAYDATASNKRGQPLSVSEYSYLYETIGYDINQQGSRTNRLTFTLPNATPLVVVYRYNTSVTTGNSIELSNTATLKAEDTKITSVTDKTTVKISSSSFNANVKGILAYKVDKDNNAVYLPGAEFSLYAWQSNDTWTLVSDDIITNANGELVDSQGRNLSLIMTDKNKNVQVHNQAFKLVETQAPSGYIFDPNNAYYFYIPDTDEKLYPKNLPTDLSAYHIATAGGYLYLTNEKTQVYELPSTGGSGTLPYTAVGGTMMLSALAYSFIHRKRRREGRADD